MNNRAKHLLMTMTPEQLAQRVSELEAQPVFTNPPVVTFTGTISMDALRDAIDTDFAERLTRAIERTRRDIDRTALGGD